MLYPARDMWATVGASKILCREECNTLAAVQGSILDMMRDCNTGIRWILNHTHFHGGDPSQVYLVGQSCGAQLAAITMITQVM